MLTTENVKQLVRGFLHEACGYLGIDDSQIGICYVPMPVQMMMVMLLKDSDDIVIDNKLLADVEHIYKIAFRNISCGKRDLSAQKASSRRNSRGYKS